MIDNSSANSRLIPFVIGVRGHCDLRTGDLVDLEDSVRSVFDDFRRRLPSTPLLLLSALAEGADQLTARCAVACGAQLAVVMPMPEALYRSLLPVEAQQLFDELIAKAVLRLHLPLQNVTEQQLRESEEARAECYEALARFLALQSGALIALWDGEPSERKGSAASVVQYVLEGPPPEAPAESEEQSGVVYHVWTPHFSHTALKEQPFKLRTLTYPGGVDAEDWKEYIVQTKRLEAFNSDVSKLDSAIGASCETLMPGEMPLALSSFDHRVADLHCAADRVSLRFNRLTKIVLKSLLGFAFTALAGFEVYAHVLPGRPALWLIYPTALLGAWLTYRFARSRQVESKYLDYRALAEALRVQFFWSVAGIGEPVADHYLQHYRTELDWIRRALSSIFLYRSPPQAPSPDELRRLKLALDHWIRHQAAWFVKKAAEQQTVLQRLDRISDTCLIAVWIVSILVPLSLLIPWAGFIKWQSIVSNETHRGLLLLLVPLPSLALGLFKVWVEQAGYDEQVRKYHHMTHTLGRETGRLQRLLKEEKAAQLREELRRLGIDALEENGEWLLLHREHPLKVTAGP